MSKARGGTRQETLIRTKEGRDKRNDQGERGNAVRINNQGERWNAIRAMRRVREGTRKAKSNERDRRETRQEAMSWTIEGNAPRSNKHQKSSFCDMPKSYRVLASDALKTISMSGNHGNPNFNGRRY